MIYLHRIGDFIRIYLPVFRRRILISLSNLILMKTRLLLLLIVASFLFQACHRAMSPYEAANSPRGKKCRDIK